MWWLARLERAGKPTPDILIGSGYLLRSQQPRDQDTSWSLGVLSVLRSRRAGLVCEQRHACHPGHCVVVTVITHLTGRIRREEGGVAIAHRELGAGRDILRLRRSRRAGSRTPRD